MKIFQQGMFSQIMSIVVAHVFTVIIGAVFGFSLMWWILDKPVWEAVFSVVFTLFYFSVIYRRAWDCASRDKKTYTSTSPYLLKGAVLAIGVFILNILLWIAYVFAWNFLTIDGSLATLTGILYNVLYIFDTFMYTGFINLSNGSMPLYAHIIIILVPTIASALGYIAGLREFLITEKLMPFIYEKRK